ncbi:MAG TPA: AAC(3) family N-acetyltransferase [Anaerolineales bacterium]|nr:AAC(3) family N-acetyltransferase [Anaerolineales bacterium]
MPSYHQWVTAFRDLGLGPSSRLLVHASLRAFRHETGGPSALLGALTAVSEMVVMPAFTRRTMVTPRTGPSDNALAYGEAPGNFEAELFHPGLPGDPDQGEVAETLRRQPRARRSVHPILSFAGIEAAEALTAQTLDEPLGTVRWLAEADADVVLIGVDHRSNVSLHHAERVAGRRTFVRWALTEQGVVTCPNVPGCSDGFEAIEGRLGGIARRIAIGGGVITSVPLRDLIHVAAGWIREDPRALLCDRPGCERCAAVRASVRTPATSQGMDPS